MVRADYGGDGTSATREGVLVSFCDVDGVNPCESPAPLPFEAAWGADGALCVARVRVEELTSLRALAARYPRLEVGETCTAESASTEGGVLLFGGSAR